MKSSMKSRVFVCNTYYQLLVAIQMKQSIFLSGQAYLVLSDDIKNVDETVENIVNIGVFDNVYCYKVRKRSKISNYFLSIFGKNICGFPKSMIVDELYSFNFDLSFHLIYAFLERKNKDIQTFRFEEGVLSYFVPFDQSNFLDKVYSARCFLGKKNARSTCTKFYCFCPELYEGNFKSIKIPPLDFSNKDNKSVFLRAFGLEKNIDNIDARTRFIYLSSIYNVDGDGRIDENEVVLNIEKIIKPEIIKVKNHPRDHTNNYKNIFEFSNAPIELIPLKVDSLNDVVILSSFSGSLLNMVSIYGDSIRCIYTTMLCDCSKNSLANHFSTIIKELCSKGFYYNKIKLVKSIDELGNVLKYYLHTNKEASTNGNVEQD